MRIDNDCDNGDTIGSRSVFITSSREWLMADSMNSTLTRSHQEISTEPIIGQQDIITAEMGATISLDVPIQIRQHGSLSGEFGVSCRPHLVVSREM